MRILSEESLCSWCEIKHTEQECALCDKCCILLENGICKECEREQEEL